VEAYRVHCRACLGDALYERLYEELRMQLYADDGAPPAADVRAWVPADKQHYVDDVEAMIAMEEQLL